MNITSCCKEFAKYVSLNVLGMVGLSCYILADTFFISRGFGANGLTALNLAIPIYSFIHGSGLMLGMGGATKYSILKGQKDSRNANIVFTHTVSLVIGFSLAFFILGFFFPGIITKLLGANQAVGPMCKTYLQVILLAAPMFLLNNVLLCFIRNDGSPLLSMIAMIGGNFSNILLDYVFIFTFHLGIFGAALATGLAPVISILILSPYFFQQKNSFHFTKIHVSKHVIMEIFSNGFPSFITEVSSGIVMIVFNSILLKLQGNVAVAAYGIIANLSLVVISVYTGIAQGIQPIISRNYGTGNQPAIKKIMRYALICLSASSIAIYFFLFFGAAQIVAIFNEEQNTLLQAVAIPGLKIYFIACLFAGFNIILSVYFTSTDNARPAHIISSLRGFLIIIPAAFLFSFLGGITGVWCVLPVTELTVSGIGLVLVSYHRKRKYQRNKKRLPAD